MTIEEYLDNMSNGGTLDRLDGIMPVSLSSVYKATRRIHNSIGYNADGIYYHYIKDHLGNICAVVNSETNTPVQRTTYYASGVPMAENLGPDVPPSLYYAMGVQYTENFGRDEQPYLYNGKEFVEVHGLNEYDSQARMYYAPIMRTTTMDPLAEEYYHISPYAWCGNNPIKYVDPDGMENVVALPNPAEETKQVIQSYESNGDVIHLFAHGEQNRIQISGKGDREKGGYITSPEQLNLFLLSNSEIWQEKETPENGGYAIIVFHSCATGQGENPIAQQISSSPEFENVLIVAPSDNIRIMSDITENVPVWNMYLNGKLVNSFDGKSRPVFSNPQKQVEKYLNKK